MNKYSLKYIFAAAFLFFASPLYSQNGLIRSYHENGKMESAVFYVNDVLDGTSRWFYDNGVLKEEITYSMGRVNGWVKTYYENGAPKEEYFVSNGVKDGLAKEFYDNGGLKTLRVFEMGRLKDRKDYNYDVTLAPPSKDKIRSLGNAKPANQKDSVQVASGSVKNHIANPEAIITTSRQEQVVTKNESKPAESPRVPKEEQLSPINGWLDISKRAAYTQEARDKKVEGQVLVRAYIDENGTVTRADVIDGPGSGLNESAADAVKQTRFNPAKKNGQPVKAVTIIPVSFKL